MLAFGDERSFAVAKTSAGVELTLLPGLANRHGLITGATGTGKTVTLQRIAEQFSRIAVPVFMADVKGDLAGSRRRGGGNARIEERARQLGVELRKEACPVVFWDVFGGSGHPVRATISDLGPLLLARMLDLNEAQEGVLNLAFKIADDAGLLLLDAKDLRAMLQHVGDHARRVHDRVRQRLRGVDRRDPARAARDRDSRRRCVLRRADAQRRRPHSDR